MALHISLAAEPVITLGSLVLTNSMLMGVVASVVVGVIMVWAGRSLNLYPRGRFLQMIEALCELMLDMIEQVTHDRRKATQFFPLLITLFLFILINNWFGLLPGVGSITVLGEHGTIPLFRGMTADLNATLALALISVILTHVYAVRELGIIAHVRKYVSWNPIMMFVGVLELVSDLAKIMSFSFRLFGNIFAGEVLLVVVSSLMPLVGPLPFFFLELFVGLVQALVFTMLTLVFLEIATSHHGEHAPQAAVAHHG
jgi:F-type H+-transporting ATPase subunit a